MLSQDTLRGIVATIKATNQQAAYVLGYDLTLLSNGYVMAKSRRADWPDWQYTPSGAFEELDSSMNIVGLLF